MDDKAFLQHALQQSFEQPIINSAEGIVWDKNASSINEYVFVDSKQADVVPYALPTKQIKDYHHAIDADIRHGTVIYTEYDMYKHDLSENIIIPESLPEIAAARQQLDMLHVNRQSAQKKKIVASVIPTKFTIQFKAVRQDYQTTRQKIQDILKAYPYAVHLSVLNDFCVLYTQTVRQCGAMHPLLRANKKYLNYYLNEAAQIMKSHYPLPDDFLETHRFTGEHSLFKKRAAAICAGKFRQLMSLLLKVSDEPAILTMVQALLADRQKYDALLAQYRTEKQITEVEKISAIRKKAQNLFNHYAFLCYLDGVRFAFENKFLDESPQPRHPALPTVSPLNELKMVAKIVSESRNIIANGKICQIYQQALTDYDQIRQDIEKSLKR